MTEKKPGTEKNPGKSPTLAHKGTARRRENEARLAAALRENLRRRKAQARARTAPADEPDSGKPDPDRRGEG